MAGCRVAVVVRETKKQSAAERIAEICSFWEDELGQVLPRPVCLVGDVCQPNLGMSHLDQLWVAKHCDSCIHNAAILDFRTAPRDQEPWVTNLDGTANVVSFCQSIGIKDFHHVSTAYVCGNRVGTIREDELDCAQGFRNDYERSKFEAEQLVVAAEGFESKTIYRPAVITADSITGYTTTYHGLHLYLRLMSLLVPQVEPDENGVRQTKIRLPMTGDEKRNVVTVDWVSEVMTRLFLTKEAHGQTYHLSPDEKLTPRQLIESCYKYFNSAGVEFCGNCDPKDQELGEFEKNFLSNVGIYNSYDRCDPVFDNHNLKEFAGDIPCPVIDEPTIHKFLRFGEKDRWGKRRPAPPASEFKASNHLESLREYAHAYKASHPEGPRLNGSFKLGFDILGLGGGQWHFDAESGQVRRGLPKEDDSFVVSFQADSLEKLIAARSTSADPMTPGLYESLLVE